MKDSKRMLVRYIETILDVIVIVGSYLLANKIKFGRFRTGILNPEEPYLTLLVIILIAYFIVSMCLPTKYNLIERGLFGEIFVVGRLQIYMLGITFGYLYFTKTSALYSRVHIAIFAVICSITMLVMRRILKRVITKEYHRSGANEKIMLVTTSERVEEVIKKIKKTRNWYFRISNIVVIDKDMTGDDVDGIEIIGNKDNLLEKIETSAIDTVFLHLPSDYSFNREEFIKTVCDMGKPVRVNIEEYDISSEMHEIGILSRFAVVTYRGVHHRIRYKLFKRAFDIIVSIFALILFVPVYILVEFGHLLENDKGHSILSLVKVGKGGRRFYMYKFRTMYLNQSRREKEGAYSVTGKLIKCLGLENLPVYWNILWGDMSVVGTKLPTLPEFVDYPRRRRKTLYVRPGLVGYWQVNKNQVKGNDDENIAELDEYYVDNWSLGLDAQIIIKSIILLFAKRKGKEEC